MVKIALMLWAEITHQQRLSKEQYRLLRADNDCFCYLVGKEDKIKKLEGYSMIHKV